MFSKLNFFGRKHIDVIFTHFGQWALSHVKASIVACRACQPFGVQKFKTSKII